MNSNRSRKPQAQSLAFQGDASAENHKKATFETFVPIETTSHLFCNSKTIAFFSFRTCRLLVVSHFVIRYLQNEFCTEFASPCIQKMLSLWRHLISLKQNKSRTKKKTHSRMLHGFLNAVIKAKIVTDVGDSQRAEGPAKIKLHFFGQ